MDKHEKMNILMFFKWMDKYEKVNILMFFK